MATTVLRNVSGSLDRRRRALGMSYAALSERSGVSMPTVVRILSGRNPHASFAHVCAIADALGMAVDVSPTIAVQQFRERQAQRKARMIVSMAQATSALEAQAVDDAALKAMERRTVHELLARSPRRLWSE